jgi:hypothetical protein
MTAEDPDWPGAKAAEDRTVTPAGTGPADDADSPARRRPTAAASQYRLKRLRDEHRTVEIVAHGYWQFVIPGSAVERDQCGDHQAASGSVSCFLAGPVSDVLAPSGSRVRERRLMLGNEVACSDGGIHFTAIAWIASSQPLLRIVEVRKEAETPPDLSFPSLDVHGVCEDP